MPIQQQRSQSIVSSANSSTTPLNASSTFTGTAELNDYPDVMVTCYTDQESALNIDFSNDGTNFDNGRSYIVAANLEEKHILPKGPRYYRVRLENTSTSNQTFLRLQSNFGEFSTKINSLNNVVRSDDDAQVVRNIGHEILVAESKYEGRFIVNKFCRNTDIDTGSLPEDLWNGSQIYTGFPTTGSAETLELFSASADDAAAGTGLRTLRVQGLDGDYNQIEEDVTLNGTTSVTTTQTFWRMHRAYGLTAGSDEANQGIITIRHSTTTANVFAELPLGKSQTYIGNYTIPAGYTGYIKKYGAELNDSNSNRAEIAIYYRQFGAPVRLLEPFYIARDKSFNNEVFGAIVCPEKTDLNLRCVDVDNNNASVTGRYDVMVVKNT